MRENDLYRGNRQDGMGVYGKFRPGCVIWELRRKEARKRCKEKSTEG